MRFSILSIIITISIIGYAQAGNRGLYITQKQYIEGMNKTLDSIISHCQKQPHHKLDFSANLFFAHEACIKNMPLETLKKYVDALKETGVSRVDINMGQFPWLNNHMPTIQKYDALIGYIRHQKLQLAINAFYGPTYHRVNNFEEWKNRALQIYPEIVQRYNPDIFIVIHEPTTMASRMGFEVTPKEWSGFVKDITKVIKQTSPYTRCGAGVLADPVFLRSEQKCFYEFLAIDDIDIITLDIYEVRSFKAANKMIAQAKKQGKSVYIEETWRPPYYIPKLGAKMTLDAISAVGIGNEVFQKLDAKWLEAMASYASSWGLEAMTPFWTQTFFKYVKDRRHDSALDPIYNLQVIGAINRGERTDTFKAFQKIVRRYSKEPFQHQVSRDVPEKYKAIYDELAIKLKEFEDTLETIESSQGDTIFAASLITANAHRGRDLLKSTAYDGVITELDRLEELGVEGVVISIGFPMFYRPFHKDRTEYIAYLDFYKKVVENIRSRGMKLIIESGVIFTQNIYTTLNTGGIYRNLSLEEYYSGRLQTITTIVKEFKPEYISIGSEPDVEAMLTGLPVNSIEAQIKYTNYILNNLEKKGLRQISVGAGVGTWHHKYMEFAENLAQNTNLDFIDIHIYPINLDYLNRAVTIADIAHKYNKEVTMSEAWLYKASEQELGGVTEDKIFARDSFSFWAPLDSYFLKVIVRLARYKTFKFISPFWSKYFYAYLDYSSELDKKPAGVILTLSSIAAAKGIAAGNYTQTGLTYKKLISNSKDNSNRLIKGFKIIQENGGRVDWDHSGSNRIVFDKKMQMDIMIYI